MPSPLSHILLFIFGFLLFFFGLNTFRRNLSLLSPKQLSLLLGHMTTTPLRGAIFGTIITAAVQSSSVVTVMTIGFVDAGIMAFPQAVGIILGTNVGTCVTVQLLGLNLGNITVPCIIAGVILILFGKRHWGASMLGFGLMFMGLSLITYASSPLAYSSAFFHAVTWVRHRPLAGIALGTIITTVIQYSSVVMGVLIALSKNNIIDLYTAMPIILGINLGTCFTGILASLGSKRSAQQVAMAHVLLNLLGLLLALPFLELFAQLVNKTTSSPGMQIANAHTIYNLLTSLLVLPFAKAFTGLVKAILPDKG